MRIDTRKAWKCVSWIGPEGELGHGMWRLADEFAPDDEWCLCLDELYPGWKHVIVQHWGTPSDTGPEGMEIHPYYGNMQIPPMGVPR